MKSNKVFFAVTALALLSGATLAQASTYSLAPAGEGPIDAPARASELSRDQVRTQVLLARQNDQLIPAGQGPIDSRPSAASELTRAEAKAETVRARYEGALVPAGEGPIDSTLVAHRGSAGYPVAFSARHGRAVRAN